MKRWCRVNGFRILDLDFRGAVIGMDPFQHRDHLALYWVKSELAGGPIQVFVGGVR